MSDLAEYFDRNGYPVRAAAIRRGGPVWLASNYGRVRSWLRSCDLGHAMGPLVDPPDEPVVVDVVVPFWSADARYLAECLEGLNAQCHARPIVHVVSDQSPWPHLPDCPNLDLRRYETQEQSGPYRIANSLVRFGHIESEYLAIHDADDISRPDRLWRQVKLLRSTTADMISSTAQNFATEDTPVSRRVLRDMPYVVPGRAFDSVRRGSCVNPSRMVRVDYFRSLNGFALLPCSGDFEFDNRSRYTGGRVIDDLEVLVDRRVHGRSLSHGLYPMGSAERREEINRLAKLQSQLADNPTIEFARQFGGLQSATELKVLK